MEKIIYCILHYGRPTLEVAAALFQVYPLGRVQNFTAFDVEIYGRERYFYDDRIRMWQPIVRTFSIQNFQQWLRLYRKYAFSLTPEGVVHCYKEVADPMPCLARELTLCSILSDDFHLASTLMQLFSIVVEETTILRAVFVNGKQACFDYFYPQGWYHENDQILLHGIDLYDRSQNPPKIVNILSSNSPLLSCEIQEAMQLWDFILKRELRKVAHTLFYLLADIVNTKSEVGLNWFNEKFQLTFGEETYTGPVRQDFTAPLLIDGFERKVTLNGNPTAIQLFHRCRLLFCRK